MVLNVQQGVCNRHKAEVLNAYRSLDKSSKCKTGIVSIVKYCRGKNLSKSRLLILSKAETDIKLIEQKVEHTYNVLLHTRVFR